MAEFSRNLKHFNDMRVWSSFKNQNALASRLAEPFCKG